MLATNPINKNESIYVTVKKIRELISNLGLQPGQKLPIKRKLASQLGVSRATINNAIFFMEDKGIVKTDIGNGVVVCEMFNSKVVTPISTSVQSKDNLDIDTIEMRYILEVKATMLATKRRTVSDLQLIDIAYESMHLAYEKEDLKMLVRADMRFHTAIFNASHNKILIYVLRSMAELIELEISRNLRYLSQQDGGFKKIITEHKDIYQAILSGNIKVAEIHAKNHLTHFYGAFTASEKKMFDYI